ncbi:hypothetical protein [Foetidibacter luteolus]|uniref:hypothetical protein n=1 Tax=Foetidibacter luteolus TaxID=2608880 RepID=UPI00129AAF59|nr:hypothetical protein [Foetidibacter luteolus]
MANTKTATFKIKYGFQISGRAFFVVGDIVSGVIKTGMVADFSNIGIDRTLKIEAIEFALHKEGNNALELIALGFNGLSESEKETLKNLPPFTKVILITEKILR